MKELNVSLIDAPRPPAPPTVRDWAAVGFRQIRLMAFSFLAVFGSVLLITWLMPAQYESELKILVKRERVDPIATPEKTAQTVIPDDVTEEDINSEVELLKSHGLLKKVALSSGLNLRVRDSFLKRLLGRSHSTEQVEDMHTVYATRNLENDLSVEPVKKTKLIKVTYRSTEPKLAEAVLHNLAGLYLEKHLEVHRVPGTLDFFQGQTERYRKGLSDAQKEIAKFAARGSVAPQIEKEIVLRKLSEFEGDLRRTQAEIAATEKRISTLEQQQKSTPARLTTQMRTSDNPLLLQQMKSTLLTLELRRTELLGKYDPGYKLVKELEAQIAQTRDALAKAENNPVREEVTDRDTTHEWLTNELAKARAELTSLKGRLSTTIQTVDRYFREAQELNEAEIRQQELIREAKTAEENLLLYSRKEEETRILEALDQKRMTNVSIAEQPTLPAIPTSPNWPLNLSLGFLLAMLVSVGLALSADYMDRSFRTPEEIETFLNIPVLASLQLETGGK